MVELWVWIVVIGLVVAVSFTGLYIWRGIWLAQHKGQKYALTRWHWYVRSTRKLEQRRIQSLQTKGAIPPSVKLTINKSTHGQRAKFTRSTHGQSTKR